MNMYDLPLESMRLCWLHYGILRIPSQFLGPQVFPCNLGAVFEVQAFDLFSGCLSCLKHFPVGLHWILRCSWILCGTLYYRTGKYSEFWEFRNLASKQVAHIQMMKGEDAVALEDLWNTLSDVFVFFAWRIWRGYQLFCASAVQRRVSWPKMCRLGATGLRDTKFLTRSMYKLQCKPATWRSFAHSGAHWIVIIAIYYTKVHHGTSAPELSKEV